VHAETCSCHADQPAHGQPRLSRRCARDVPPTHHLSLLSPAAAAFNTSAVKSRCSCTIDRFAVTRSSAVILTAQLRPLFTAGPKDQHAAVEAGPEDRRLAAEASETALDPAEQLARSGDPWAAERPARGGVAC
jgi:hypothetical protein